MANTVDRRVFLRLLRRFPMAFMKKSKDGGSRPMAHALFDGLYLRPFVCIALSYIYKCSFFFSTQVISLPFFIYQQFLTFDCMFSSSWKYIKHLAMTGMASIPPEVAEKNLMVANVVHDVFSALFPSNSLPRGLETSRWASQSVVQQTGSQGLTDSIWAPKENSKKDPEKVCYFCSLSVSF